MTTEERVIEAMELLRDQIERYIGVCEKTPAEMISGYVRAVGIRTAQARADVYRTAARECPDPVWKERYGRTADRMQDAINAERRSAAA